MRDNAGIFRAPDLARQLLLAQRMPSARHEAFVEPIRAEPALLGTLVSFAVGEQRAAELLQQLDLVHARVGDPTVPQLVPPSRICELALEVPARGRRRSLAAVVLVEVQLRRARDKEQSWPLYWAATHARHGGATVWLIVITASRATEQWAERVLAGVIPARGRWLVLGPGHVPRIIDPEMAKAAPNAAVLSALVHAGSANDAELVESIAAACSTFPRERVKVIYDVFRHSLSEASGHQLEKLMLEHSYPISAWGRGLVASGRKEGRHEGQLETARANLLTLITGRGLSLTRAQRARIRACKELATLDRWFKRAISVDTAAEIFATQRRARTSGARRTSRARTR